MNLAATFAFNVGREFADIVGFLRSTVPVWTNPQYKGSQTIQSHEFNQKFLYGTFIR